MKKQILLGTKNQAKIAHLREIFKPLPLKILSLRDLKIDLTVKEDGKSPRENARKKALTYFAQARIPTLATDAGLTIAKLPDDKQPGVFVNRINRTGQRVTEREIRDYYLRELAQVGGESSGTWDVCIVLMVSPDRVFSQSYSFEIRLTSKLHSKTLTTGTPLNALMIDPATGRYFSEMSWKEWPDAHCFLAFMKRHLNEL